MSAWVVVGVLLEVAAGMGIVASTRRGVFRPTAPDRYSAPLPPWRGWLVYSLSGGVVTGGLISLREGLGWWSLPLGLVVALSTAALLALLLRWRAKA